MISMVELQLIYKALGARRGVRAAFTFWLLCYFGWLWSSIGMVIYVLLTLSGLAEFLERLEVEMTSAELTAIAIALMVGAVALPMSLRLFRRKAGLRA